MKILYVANSAKFFISHRLNLAVEAKNLGYQVYLAAPHDYKSFSILGEMGIICKSIDISRTFHIIQDFKTLFHLRRLIKKINPDLIQNTALKAILLGTLAAMFVTRKPIIVNAVSGLGYSFLDKSVKARIYKSIILSILKLISRANKVKLGYIFQNDDDKLLFVKHHICFRENSFLIKGAGVEIPRKIFTTPKCNVLTITMVSRIIKDKGVIEYLQAAKSLEQSYRKQVRFQLIGDFDYSNPSALRFTEIEKYLVPGFIDFLGPKENILEIYSGTDIACLPSYREGMPKSLIEAMAMECAIITTDVPGCRQCVQPNHNGLLVPLKSSEMLALAFIELIKNSKTVDSMKKNSKKLFMKEMSTEIIVQKTFNVYTTLILSNKND